MERKAKKLTVTNPGYHRLWRWFGLSRASFCVLPRVMMHDMPDKWQAKMAALLDEWEETWVNRPDGQEMVVWQVDGKFAKFPHSMLDYRHPRGEFLDEMRGKNGRREME